MGSLFTVRLVGDDEEHLAAVAEAALDEIARVERLLSWRDPRSQCARIVREAAHGDVLVDREMFDLLARCEAARTLTSGAFNVAYRAGTATAIDGDLLQLDPHRRTARLADGDVRLDFGAVGKGYALDVAAAEIRRYGVRDALLDGGASSIVALGRNLDGAPWFVAIRDPGAGTNNPETPVGPSATIPLFDEGLSSSATFDSDDVSHPSDLVDRRTGRPLSEPAAVTVVAASAATAEILSTALLAMGKRAAREYIGTSPARLVAEATRVAWITPGDPATAGPSPTLDWLLNRSTP